MRDLYHNLANATSISPALNAATVTGAAVDLQGYEGALVLVQVGTITDKQHTPKITECDTSNGQFTDVAAADQLGSFALLATGVNQQVAYMGSKRYIKVVSTIVDAGGATGGVYGAVVIKGHARHKVSQTV